MNIEYLNTDLEIKSKEDIAPILEAFGEKIYVLHQEINKDIHFVCCETNSNLIDANSAAAYFCTLVEDLPNNVREIWNKCDTRILDMGYQSGMLPNSYKSELEATTVKRMAELGISIVVTIYSLSENNTI